MQELVLDKYLTITQKYWPVFLCIGQYLFVPGLYGEFWSNTLLLYINCRVLNEYKRMTACVSENSLMFFRLMGNSTIQFVSCTRVAALPSRTQWRHLLTCSSFAFVTETNNDDSETSARGCTSIHHLICTVWYIDLRELRSEILSYDLKLMFYAKVDSSSFRRENLKVGLPQA